MNVTSEDIHNLANVVAELESVKDAAVQANASLINQITGLTESLTSANQRADSLQAQLDTIKTAVPVMNITDDPQAHDNLINIINQITNSLPQKSELTEPAPAEPAPEAPTQAEAPQAEPQPEQVVAAPAPAPEAPAEPAQ